MYNPESLATNHVYLKWCIIVFPIGFVFAVEDIHFIQSCKCFKVTLKNKEFGLFYIIDRQAFSLNLFIDYPCMILKTIL